MSDPQIDPALAPLGPLSAEVSPPPLAAGYANPLVGVASEFFKLHQADNRRQANRELDRREQLAQQFDQFASDPRYSNHPDIQREAHFHAAAIRQIPYNKNLPTQYKPNNDGQIPAYGALFHRAAQAEIRRNGEPSKPPEPPPPPPVANPFGADTSGVSALSAGPPAPPSAAPVPGGVQPMPGKVSPAPAIGSAPPAPPDAAAVPPPPAMPAAVTQSADSSNEIYPMTPPEMAAFNNSIPASSAPELAEQLGIDTDANPNALIDLRMLKGAGMLNKSRDREVRMRIAGLDPETGDRLPPEQQTPIAHYRNAQADLAEARVALVHAQTISEPIKRDAAIALAKEHLSLAQRNSDIAASRLGVEQGRLALAQSLAPSLLNNSDRLDQLIDAENNGADLTKLGVSKRTHADMVQRRLERQSSGDGAAAFPVSLNTQAQKILTTQGEMRSNTQDLLRVLEPYKDNNTPFDQLPDAIKYKLGMASDDALAAMQSKFSIEKYAGTMALIPGIRRGDIIEKASKHLPVFGKDSPKLMYDKLKNADDFYANNQANALKYGARTGVVSGRTITSEPPAMSTHPVSQSEWNALIGKGHTAADLTKSGIFVK